MPKHDFEHFQPDRMREAGGQRQSARVVETVGKMYDAFASLTRANPSQALMMARIQHEDFEREILPAIVEGAREAGLSWADIGDQLGLSKNAAHKRWRHVDPGDGDA